MNLVFITIMLSQWEFHKNRIINIEIFCVWFSSLSLMPFQLIPGWNSTILISYSFVFVCFFLFSWDASYLGMLQEILWNFMYKFLCEYKFSSSRINPNRGITESYVKYMFNFLRSWQTPSKLTVSFYMVTGNVGQIHLPHIFVRHHVANSWSSIIINMQRYLTALLISISVMINGSTHFFKCLFAIPLSSFW